MAVELVEVLSAAVVLVVVEVEVEEARLSIASRRVLSSSRATSQLPVRMSEASLPQCAEVVRSTSVERIRK